MTRTNRPFTLIEILTVIVVISVIVGITVPAYNRLMTGNAVSYGNRLVTSQLNMARTHACARRRSVAVLFPDYNISYNSELKDPVALRTFRCAYVEYDGSDWVFDGWVEGSKWEYLPQGAFFPTTGLVKSADVKLTNDEDGVINTGTEVPIPSIIFKTNGRPVVGSGNPKVKVSEGVVTDNEGNITKKNDANNFLATVNRYTGSVITKTEEE